MGGSGKARPTKMGVEMNKIKRKVKCKVCHGVYYWKGHGPRGWPEWCCVNCAKVTSRRSHRPEITLPRREFQRRLDKRNKSIEDGTL